MRKIFFILNLLISITCFGQSAKKEIKSYVDFLKEQKTSSKDYILKLFEKYDLVVLCERDHRDITQYDFILDLIRDKRFIEKVGYIFSEIGGSNLNPSMNQFLHSDDLDSITVKKSIRDFHRNASFYPLWEKYAFTYFVNGLYKINSTLPGNLKLSYYPSDIFFEWNHYNSKEDYQKFMLTIDSRDKIMAEQIIKEYDSICKATTARKKALIIMNYRHAFNNGFIYSNGWKPDNAGKYLFDKYPNRIANVYINYLRLAENIKEGGVDIFQIQDGRWDAAFEVTGNRSVGFDFDNSPFGNDFFDLFTFQEHNCKYKDVFTGFVFYLPLEKHRLAEGIPDIIGNDFAEEMIRRHEIAGYNTNIDTIRKWYDTLKFTQYNQLLEYKANIRKYK